MELVQELDIAARGAKRESTEQKHVPAVTEPVVADLDIAVCGAIRGAMSAV